MKNISTFGCHFFAFVKAKTSFLLGVSQAYLDYIGDFLMFFTNSGSEAGAWD